MILGYKPGLIMSLGVLRKNNSSYILSRMRDLILNKCDGLEKEPFLSCDIRSNAYKIAPVDANFFPAGFNNFNNTSVQLAVTLMQQYLCRTSPNATKIAIVPENYTRNIRYLENIGSMRDIFHLAGYQCEIMNPFIDEALKINSIKTGEFSIFPMTCLNNRAVARELFDPDVLIINNDLLSKSLYDILQDINQQDIFPNIRTGWCCRKKDTYFQYYNSLVHEMSECIGIDPWMFTVETRVCDDVDFMDGSGMDRLSEIVDQLLRDIAIEYKRHNITEKPYVFIKSDHGTYGMGVVAVFEANEVLNFSRNARKKMHTVKHGTRNTRVLVQEGIKTDIQVGNSYSAEHLVYYVNSSAFGNLMRYNKNKDNFMNLNSMGADFIDVSSDTMNPLLSIVVLLSEAAARLEYNDIIR